MRAFPVLEYSARSPAVLFPVGTRAAGVVFVRRSRGAEADPRVLLALAMSAWPPEPGRMVTHQRGQLARCRRFSR